VQGLNVRDKNLSVVGMQIAADQYSNLPVWFDEYRRAEVPDDEYAAWLILEVEGRAERGDPRKGPLFGIIEALKARGRPGKAPRTASQSPLAMEETE
jgi:hypothetical protein